MLCVCVCARARSYTYTLEAKIITCTCLLFLYFFPRNIARRCTVFILCFCARLMCRDMRSYATPGDNRAGARGRPRALRCPPPPTHTHTPGCTDHANDNRPPTSASCYTHRCTAVSPRAGMTGPMCIYI